MKRSSIAAALVVITIGLAYWLTPIEALEQTPGPQQNPQFQVERFQGEEARRYLNTRIAQNASFKAAYERSQQQMLARGYMATWTVYVERRFTRKPVDRSLQGRVRQLMDVIVSPVSAQGYSESSESGEFIVSAWDDGNPDTWEGSVYVHRYSDGAWRLFDMQLDAGTSEAAANDPYYNNFLDGRGGGGPGGPLPINGPLDRGPRAVFVNLVGADTDVARLEAANITATANAQCDWLCQAGQWARCTRHGCVGSAIACTRTGPLWLPCFGAVCTGVQVVCALNTWF